MRILILNWRDPYHPLAGGAEVMVLEHAKYWAKKKHEVVWFSASFKNAKREEFVEGIKVIRRGSHFTVKFWAFIAYLTNTIGKADIILDCFHFHPYFSTLYMRGRKIALIHEVAGKIWFDNIAFPIAFLGYITEPLAFLFYKNIPFITVSNSTKKDLKKLGIKKVYVIENGVRHVIPTSKKKEKDPTLIFMGRISKDKGVEDAIEIMSGLLLHFKNIKLWIVGKEESKKYLRDLKKTVLKKGLKKNITFHGYVSEKDKYKLLKKSWILIHPSKKEGWGLTVIEAASQGVPTVGYNVEGLRDSVKNGETGILSDVNREKLKETVTEILSDKKLLNRLSKNAQKYAKQFSWEKATKESLKVIERYVKK